MELTGFRVFLAVFVLVAQLVPSWGRAAAPAESAAGGEWALLRKWTESQSEAGKNPYSHDVMAKPSVRFTSSTSAATTFVIDGVDLNPEYHHTWRETPESLSVGEETRLYMEVHKVEGSPNPSQPYGQQVSVNATPFTLAVEGLTGVSIIRFTTAIDPRDLTFAKLDDQIDSGDILFEERVGVTDPGMYKFNPWQVTDGKPGDYLLIAFMGQSTLGMQAPVHGMQGVSGSASALAFFLYSYGGVAESRKIALCEEALSFFTQEKMEKAGYGTGTERLDSGIRRAESDLKDDFQKALDLYKQNHGEVYTTRNAYGSVGAATWLATTQGMDPAINEHYVFYRGIAEQGTEPALRDAIVNFHAEKNKGQTSEYKLTPGDVFFLALQQRQGNATEAMLLAHNTLRNLARGDARPDQPLVKLTGVAQQPEFVDKYLDTLRDSFRQGGRDNAGPWYHLFGTAYFAMENQGDYGAAMTLLPLNPLVTGQAYVLKGFVSWALTEGGWKSSEQDLWSAVANWFEQYVRESDAEGRTPDPEKFCFNVWGGKIGSNLMGQLPVRSASESAAKALPPGTPLPALPGPAPLEPGIASGTHAIGSGSPVIVTWQSTEYRMTVDQTTGASEGYFPVVLAPLPEPDGTYALAWVDTGSEPYDLTFQAVRDGTLHLLEYSGARGQAASYEIDVREGERLTMAVDPAGLSPAVTREDGSSLQPALAAVEAKAVPTAGGTTSVGYGARNPSASEDGDGPGLWLVVAGGFVVGGTATALVRRSRRGQKSGQATVTGGRRQTTPMNKTDRAKTGRACVSCGAPINATARFCGACGTTVEWEIERQARANGPERRTCPKCGETAGPEARFCGACGQTLAAGSDKTEEGETR